MALDSLFSCFCVSRRDLHFSSVIRGVTNPPYSLKSLWSRREQKQVLSAWKWKTLLTTDGKLRDGVKFLKRVCSGGVEWSIRAEVWPFLLGVYDLTSTKEERDLTRGNKRKEYEQLREQCHQFPKHKNEHVKINESGGRTRRNNGRILDSKLSYNSLDLVSARESLSGTGVFLLCDVTDSEATQASNFSESMENIFHYLSFDEEVQPEPTSAEDFATWQRIMRLDAIRDSGEWIPYSPVYATVSKGEACHSAEIVGLKNYDHLEPSRIFHAARLVTILEAYALYDREIGYCQGMSDLLSPIISVITDDSDAFWCFVAFMKRARHNFRLDEAGIRRQLNIISKIIQCKDAHLFRHLEKLQAGDCFFVYRMVAVLFRRELTFEQTLCLWEVMWANQAAIRVGIEKLKQRVPPTEDLLLYAIAAFVLQRRKVIIEKYSGMDEIVKECNAMQGKLDVWKLIDDAYNLVVTLHHKIESFF